VDISQIVTLPEFIDRSKKLEEALQAGSLEYYCSEKVENLLILLELTKKTLSNIKLYLKLEFFMMLNVGKGSN